MEFPINSWELSPCFRDNQNKITLLDSLFATGRVAGNSIRVVSEASPDGPAQLNIDLAAKRLVSTRNFLSRRYGLNPDSLELVNGKVDWKGFRCYLAQSGVPASAQLLSIASSGNDADPASAAHRIKALKAHNSGRTWKWIAKEVLPHFRRSRLITVVMPAAELDMADIDTIPERDIAPESRERADSIAAELTEESPLPEISTTAESTTAPCHRTWHLSTNLPELAMLIGNLGVGYDFACNWSAMLSVHYSAVNYGSARRKFRTFMLRPEVRWWTNTAGKGLFVDAHLGLAYYNVALKHWDYRVQDAGGKTPALGGGLGVGYRLRLHNHWAIEAQIGAGLYRLKYDRFENRPGGALVSTRSQVWAGIDNVGLSVVYNFRSQPR